MPIAKIAHDEKSSDSSSLNRKIVSCRIGSENRNAVSVDLKRLENEITAFENTSMKISAMKNKLMMRSSSLALMNGGSASFMNLKANMNRKNSPAQKIVPSTVTTVIFNKDSRCMPFRWLTIDRQRK